MLLSALSVSMFFHETDKTSRHRKGYRNDVSCEYCQSNPPLTCSTAAPSERMKKPLLPNEITNICETD